MENKKVSGFWYILPILLGIIGGLIAWGVNKKHDLKIAVSFLWVGGIISVITGILFSIVFFIVATSLGGARGAAEDAKTMSIMAQMRSLSELEYVKEFSYSNINCSFGEMATLCKELKDSNGHLPVIHSSTENYCIYTETKDGYVCIDSQFSFYKTDVFPGGFGYCDGVTFSCPAPVLD